MSTTQVWIPEVKEPDLSTLTARLKFIAQGRGMSDTAFGQSLGYNVNTYLSWLRGDTNPSSELDLVWRVWKQYGVPPTWLGWGPEAYEMLGEATGGYAGYGVGAGAN